MFEVIIVLVIIGTIMGLVAPRVGHVAAGIKRAEAIKILNSAFHMASSIAVATGKPATLVFDFDEGKLQIQRSEKNTAQYTLSDMPEGVRADSLFDDLQQFTLPENTVLDPYFDRLDPEASSEYRFFPNGEAAGTTLSIIIDERLKLTIDVDRLTGRPLIVSHEN